MAVLVGMAVLQVTGNLVKQQLKVSEKYVHSLPLNETVVIDKVGGQSVRERALFCSVCVLFDFFLLSSCPGSVLILFTLSSGQNYLHTGEGDY